MEEKKSIIDKFISGIFDLIFSKEKSIERWLVFLVLIGFILRLIGAFNLGAFPDDMVHGSQTAGILNAKLLSTHSTPPLNFYLTDLSFKILGYTTLASRFPQLIFGTLLIVLIFLITKKFFDKKVALAAAFFVTFSSLLVRMTIAEQSLVVLFFSFFGVYLGLEYIEKRKIYFLIFSAVLFGLAVLTKYSAPLFIFSFLIFSAYYIKSNKEKIFTKKNIWHLVLFFIIILIFSSPFLVFNYLLYKDKGIVDIYFSRIVNLNSTQQLYSGLAGQQNTVFDNLSKIGNYHNISLIFNSDLIIALFGILGLFFMFKDKKKFALSFFFIFLIIPFILQTGGSAIEKHFIFIPFLFSIPAGLSLNFILNKLDKKYLKIIFLLILIVLLVINLGTRYGTPYYYFSSSEISQLKSFINNNVNQEDLIIFDSRIYSSEVFWLATPHHFIDLQQFPDFYKFNQNLSSSYKNSVRTYVIECVQDDCNWGWVYSKPDFNQTSEALIQFLKAYSKPIESIGSYDYKGNELLSSKEKTEKFAVYSLTLDLNPGLVEQTDDMHSFYFVPYFYKNMNGYLFSYNLKSSTDILLNKFAYFMIIFSVILAVLSIFLLFFFL